MQENGPVIHSVSRTMRCNRSFKIHSNRAIAFRIIANRP